MVRKHDVRSRRDADPRDVDAQLRQHVELVDEPAHRDDGAGADQELRPFDERPGRHDAQRELRVADLDGVPGVVAAAEARDDAVLAREQIHDAPFAFVAPLDADADV